MAITYEKEGQGSSRGGEYTSVTDQVAQTNTFDCEWPILRDQFRIALDASLQTFMNRGPPRSAVRGVSPSVPGPSISPSLTSTQDGKPPPESLLLSPGDPSIPLDPTTTSSDSTSIEGESSGSPRNGTSQDTPLDPTDESDVPSTNGGLVIPPFPPLNKNKKKRENVLPSSKLNGHPRPGSAPDDDWDEDLVIGGKKLPGWMDEDEAKKEVQRVGKLLEDTTEPPFTIQRIAELLVDPTRMHTSIGKFLRALEKALLVNTPWEAPSYTYVPPVEMTSGGLYGASSSRSVSSPSSESGSDEDSLLPPGASTPMFSPIPFLRHPNADGMEIDMDMIQGRTSGKDVEEGLMSPLVLGDHSTEAQMTDTTAIRNSTPEPDPSASPTKPSPVSPLSDTKSAATQVAIGPSDPGHQSYLGRVDELDTGPLSQTVNNGAKGEDGEDEIMTPGAGEGGNMTPHGMSDRPVPISSTTVVGEEERKIAGIPKTSLGDRFVKAEDEAGGS